jgi:hypothetical protein
VDCCLFVSRLIQEECLVLEQPEVAPVQAELLELVVVEQEEVEESLRPFYFDPEEFEDL